MQTEERIVAETLNFRVPPAVRIEVERLAKERSTLIGKNIPLVQIILEALEYGLPVVDRELKHHILIPSSIRTRTEQLAYLAKELIVKGLEASFTDTELSPSPSA